MLYYRRSSVGKDQAPTHLSRMSPIKDVDSTAPSREVTLNKTPVLPSIGALQFGTPPQPGKLPSVRVLDC